MPDHPLTPAQLAAMRAEYRLAADTYTFATLPEPDATMIAVALNHVPVLLDEVERLQQENASLRTSRGQVAAENLELRKALERAEWGSWWADDADGIWQYACPVCGGLKQNGHEFKCALDRALNVTTAPQADAARGEG